MNSIARNSRGRSSGRGAGLLLKSALIFALVCTSCLPNWLLGIEDEDGGCNTDTYHLGFPVLARALASYHPTLDALQGRQADSVYIGDSLVAFWPPAPHPAGHPWNLEGPAAATIQANPGTTTAHATNAANALNAQGAGLIINAGIGGNTSCDIAARAMQHVTAFRPRNIFTDGGGNDLILGVPEVTVQNNLTVYLTLLRGTNPDARIVFMGIPPTRVPQMTPARENINAVVRATLREIGNACYIDVDDYLAVRGIHGGPIRGDQTVDGIHWEPDAYIELRARADGAFAETSLTERNEIRGVECFE